MHSIAVICVRIVLLSVPVYVAIVLVLLGGLVLANHAMVGKVYVGRCLS